MAFPKKIGSLWKKKSKKDGTAFLSGNINGTEVIIFMNKRKNDPKHPDFEVYPSQPRQAPAQPTQAPADDFADF